MNRGRIAAEFVMGTNRIVGHLLVCLVAVGALSCGGSQGYGAAMPPEEEGFEEAAADEEGFEEGAAEEEGFEEGAAEEAAEENFTRVRVFYATDRNRTGSKQPRSVYGGKRGDGGLKLGFCEVSIPRDHRMAEVERPSLLKLEFREDPEKHVVLLDVRQRSYQEFYEEMHRKTTGSESGMVLLFIHGFNVTFEGAAHRTAQLAYDLGIDGAPVMYSWPAPSLYPESEANAEWTWRRLRWFLRDLVRRSGATTIHVVAHSMGNRPLSKALELIAAKEPESLPIFQQIFLAAPDIDADTFRQISRAISRSGKRTTLYASSEDAALKASHAVHGYSRAGDTSGSVVIVPGVDTIDVSKVDTSLLGHSYYGDQRSIVADIFALLRRDIPPVERAGITSAAGESGTYYRFVP